MSLQWFPWILIAFLIPILMSIENKVFNIALVMAYKKIIKTVSKTELMAFSSVNTYYISFILYVSIFLAVPFFGRVSYLEGELFTLKNFNIFTSFNQSWFKTIGGTMIKYIISLNFYVPVGIELGLWALKLYC